MFHYKTKRYGFSERTCKASKEKGICKPWYNELKSLNGDNINAMAQMYLKGIDFALPMITPTTASLERISRAKWNNTGFSLTMI